MEPPLRGHPDDRPTLLERPFDNVNININVFIFTLNQRPSLLKGHISYAKDYFLVYIYSDMCYLCRSGRYTTGQASSVS